MQQYNLINSSVPGSQHMILQKLKNVKGVPASLLSQVTNLTVTKDEDVISHYTLLHNNAHSNITSLFNEKNNRLPEEDTITVADGFIGAYPETFMQVDEAHLEYFVDMLLSMRTSEDYHQLMDHFGVRRTDPEFWNHSDKIQDRYAKRHPYNSGLLDYSRLENR